MQIHLTEPPGMIERLGDLFCIEMEFSRRYSRVSHWSRRNRYSM